MARTQIPEMTEERITARLSIWMLSAKDGNPTTTDRIETVVEFMGIVGFTPAIVEQVVRTAAKTAGLDEEDAVLRFVPVAKVTVSKRKRKNGNDNAKS